MPDGTATAHVYRPKLLTVFAEGYGFEAFRKDVTAGITVAIVALPLSMAIAVASGVTPERGIPPTLLARRRGDRMRRRARLFLQGFINPSC
jgi:hypothetical protein